MATRNRNINKRMNWFDRQFLRAQDFMDEQDYHLDRLRRHNRGLHTPGVIDDLTVTGTVGANTIRIAPGTALDPSGREIVLLAPATPTLPIGPTQVEVYILASEVETDPSTDPGVTGNTRISETPTITFRRTLPGPAEGIPTDGLILARADLNGTGQLTSPPVDMRIPAAAVVNNDITVRSVTLKRDGVPSAQWPKLSCSAANQAALETGSLRLDNNREIFFTDNGQIRSFDNTHRLVFNRASNRTELHEIGDILFLTGNPPTEKMRILANGNAGIGVDTPARRLHVREATTFCARFETTTTDAMVVELKSNSATWEHSVAGSAGAFGGSMPASSHYIFRQGSPAPALTIAPSNNVGIGTATPQQALSVSGGVNIDQDNANNGAINPGLTFGSASGEGIASKRTATGNQFGLDFYTGSIARLRINNAGQVILGSATSIVSGAELSLTGPIGFRNATTPMMYIFESGITNPPRPIISHSPTSSNWGLLYVDVSDTMVFQSNGNPVLSINLGNRSVKIDGPLEVTGAKTGYVVDKFINNIGETLEEGDVIVIGDNQATGRYGVNDRIPIPEVELAQEANDVRVCGIVCQVSIEGDNEAGAADGEEAENDSSEKSSRKGKKKQEATSSKRGNKAEAKAEEITKVAPGQMGLMVTLGAFAHCKVDADIAPINVGDLLTTSPTKGHAQKVTDRAKALGAIVGKALGSLKKGKGTIPVIVNLQ